MAHIPKHKTTEDELKKACQEKGLKATRQRLEILKIIVSAKNHPSVDTVYQQAKARIPGISFDPVYRTLSSFEEYKLQKARYDVTERPPATTQKN